MSAQSEVRKSFAETLRPLIIKATKVAPHADAPPDDLRRALVEAALDPSLFITFCTDGEGKPGYVRISSSSPDDPQWDLFVALAVFRLANSRLRAEQSIPSTTVNALDAGKGES